MDDVPEREHQIYLLVNEDQARALLRGIVPEEVRAMARCAVDWEWTLAKAMARPVEQPRRKRVK